MTRDNRQKALTKEIAKARLALASAEFSLNGHFSDTAANRAYYCVFHAARAALLTIGVQPKTHKGVNERFNLDLVIPQKIESDYLSILGREQTRRETADYSVDEEIGEQEAELLVSEARRFLVRIEELIRSSGWTI